MGWVLCCVVWWVVVCVCMCISRKIVERCLCLRLSPPGDGRGDVLAHNSPPASTILGQPAESIPGLPSQLHLFFCSSSPGAQRSASIFCRFQVRHICIVYKCIRISPPKVRHILPCCSFFRVFSRGLYMLLSVKIIYTAKAFHTLYPQKC